MCLCILSGGLSVLATIKKPKLWFKKHKLSAFFCAIFAFIAFSLIFIYKIFVQFPHFSSLHSISGLITFLLIIANLFLGLFRKKNNNVSRKIHQILGIFLFFVLIFMAISGLLRFLQLN
jgi:uncharacterized membrane protein